MSQPVSFTEEMKGFVTFGESDYEAGYRTGEHSGTALMFHLTITVEDIEAFLVDDQRMASATGWVQCDALGGRLRVVEGIFNLFVEPLGGSSIAREMRYRLFFADRSGNPVTLVGHKEIKDDPGFDLWRDTTTLFTELHSGHVRPGDTPTQPVLAVGLIVIEVLDFVRQLTTFRGSPGAVAQFGRSFMGELWDRYGNPFSAEGAS